MTLRSTTNGPARHTPRHNDPTLSLVGDTAAVTSALFAGGAAYVAYGALKQARAAAADARNTADEASRPALKVQIEDLNGQLAFLVVNAGGGLAKGAFATMISGHREVTVVLGSVLAPGESRHVITDLPSPGAMEEVKDLMVSVICRDVSERSWAWNQLGARALLVGPADPTSPTSVSAEEAVRALWPDFSSFDGLTAGTARVGKRART